MHGMKKHLLLLGFLVVVLLVFAGCSQQVQPTAQKATEEEKQVVAEAAAPEEEKAAEATAAAPAEETAKKTLYQLVQEEPNKDGCASCHKPDDKNMLANKVKKVSDIHPTLDVKTNSVDTCFGCHNDNNPEIYKRFKNRIHKAHSQSQYFGPNYNGTCYTCHTLNENGELSIKRPQQQ